MFKLDTILKIIMMDRQNYVEIMLKPDNNAAKFSAASLSILHNYSNNPT